MTEAGCHRLAVVCAQRWVQEFPANSPRSSSSCSSCLLPARLSSSPIPKAGCGVVSLMGCAWLAAQQHPWTASKGCKMLCGQGHVRTSRERVLSHLLLPPRSYFVCQSLKETAEFLALASWHAGVKQMAASTEDLPLFHWWRKLCRRATRLSTL